MLFYYFDLQSAFFILVGVILWDLISNNHVIIRSCRAYDLLVLEIIQGLILEKVTLDALTWGSLPRLLNSVQTLVGIMAWKMVDKLILEGGKINMATSITYHLSNVYSLAIINCMATVVINMVW